MYDETIYGDVALDARSANTTETSCKHGGKAELCQQLIYVLTLFNSLEPTSGLLANSLTLAPLANSSLALVESSCSSPACFFNISTHNTTN